jgi:ribosomal protein L4
MTQFRLVNDISGYDLIIAHDIVITQAALQELQQNTTSETR